MRLSLPLGKAHELGMALSTTAALLIVLVGGEAPPLAWIAIGAPWLSFALAAKGRAAPGSLGTVLGAAAIALGGATIFQRGVESSVLAAAIALIGLLAARLLTRRTVAHDMQALVLSFLLVVSGSVLNVGINYVLVFAVYAVTTVWALATRQLLAGAERGRTSAAAKRRTDVVTPLFFLGTAGTSLLVLLSTSLLFVAFPRVGFGNLGIAGQQAGSFPDGVSLRGAPRGGSGSEEVVARVRKVSTAAFDRGLYLRGAVYEVVSEEGFSQAPTPPDVELGKLVLAGAQEEGRYEISLQPGLGRVLLALGPVTTARGLSGGHSNPNFALSVDGLNDRTELMAGARVTAAYRYDVAGGIAGPGYIPTKPARGKKKALDPKDPDDAQLYAVPGDLDPRVVELARSIVGDAVTDVEKADRLRAFLFTQFAYTLEQPNGGKPRPLIAFLLEDRRGHCEYFASAFALLLRTQGIAARVVGGYQGGAWDDADDVIVFSAKNAHAWVEWFLPGQGWIVDDATPLAGAQRERLAGWRALLERTRRFWDDRVLDYALQDQIDLVKGASRALSTGFDDVDGAAAAKRVLPFAAVAAVIAAVVVVRRRRRLAIAGGHALARAIVSAAANLGIDCALSSTVRELVLQAVASPVLGEAERRVFILALRAYEEDRFAGRALDGARAKEMIAALARLPRRRPPR